MNTHPQTGMHYVHVIPDEWGAHVDVHACYTEFAQRTAWSSVMTPDEFQRFRHDDPAFKDERYFFLLWDYAQNPGLKTDRKSIVTAVYSEAIGRGRRTEGMLDPHVHVMGRFRKSAPDLDAVFGHTHWMAQELSAIFDLPAYVMPVGWNPAAMGNPRWNAPKHDNLTFHGSMAGRRKVILPYFEKFFGKDLKIVGAFGRHLTGALDTARANLYIAHSACGSYSTWRLWQLLATSCALISEPGDCWPFEKHHYAEIPEIGIDNMESVGHEIHRLLLSVNFGGIARRAHDDLAPEYTTDKCVERFLVPASEKIRSARGAA